MNKDTVCKVAIIEPGLVPDGLEGTYDDYPTTVSRLMTPLLPPAEFTPISIVRGAPLPAATDYDAYFIMGSRHGVYDDLPWIEPLKAFIVEAGRHNRPMVGICFGHQIIAEAMGGKVVKAEIGWGAGRQTYPIELTEDWMQPARDEISALCMHQDQVIELPESARVLAGNEFCPYAILSYDSPAISFQFHPEFSREYIDDLIRSRRGSLIPEPIADAGLSSVPEPLDHDTVADWISRFIRHHI